MQFFLQQGWLKVDRCAPKENKRLLKALGRKSINQSIKYKNDLDFLRSSRLHHSHPDFLYTSPSLVLQHFHHAVTEFCIMVMYSADYFCPHDIKICLEKKREKRSLFVKLPQKQKSDNPSLGMSVRKLCKCKCKTSAACINAFIYTNCKPKTFHPLIPSPLCARICPWHWKRNLGGKT